MHKVAKLKFIAAACSMWACSINAQNTTNNIRNSGMCNPVVTGGSSSVVIRCSGVSGEKANQLIELMNRILAQHLDLSEVNSKLDTMGSQLSDINATLNPLFGAPVEIVKLYEEAQTLTRSCQNFALDWSSASLARAQSRLHNQATGGIPDLTDRRTALAQQQGDIYRRTLLPRVNTLEPDLQQAAGLRSLPDSFVIDVNSPGVAGVVASRIRRLISIAESRAQQTGQPVNPHIFEQSKALAEDLETFSTQWKTAERALLHSNTSTEADSPMKAMDQLNQEKSAQYVKALAPSLVSWRTRALRFIPSYTSSVEYSTVSTAQELYRVCTDVALIQQAYQQKQQNLMLDKRATPPGR